MRCSICLRRQNSLEPFSNEKICLLRVQHEDSCDVTSCCQQLCSFLFQIVCLLSFWAIWPVWCKINISWVNICQKSSSKIFLKQCFILMTLSLLMIFQSVQLISQPNLTEFAESWMEILWVSLNPEKCPFPLTIVRSVYPLSSDPCGGPPSHLWLVTDITLTNLSENFKQLHNLRSWLAWICKISLNFLLMVWISQLY